MQLSSWLEQFRTVPTPLTNRQRSFLWIAAIVVALSRLYAISRSLWDWDEALFCLGVRDYDVAQHHPHPPGYPLFIAAAKLLRPLAGSDFRALQIVTVLGAMALFPVVFSLGREARLPFWTAFSGALLYVFFPNVWFHGGTAFSDVPGTALVIAACALLLRGCRSRSWYVAGAFVLGLSIAFRPQNVLIAAAPSFLATWFRVRDRWREVFVAIAIGAIVVGAAYGGAAAASESVHNFVNAVRAQQHYMVQIDSYHNPGRTPLNELLFDFFVTPMRGGRAAIAAGFLAIAGFVTAIAFRRWPVLFIVLMFLPFNVFAWLMFDTGALTRYAVAWVAMQAFLCVDFLAAIASIIGRFSPVLGGAAEACAVAGIAVYAIAWTIPALKIVRRDPSPPVEAMQWVASNVPRGSKVVIWPGLGPFAWYFLQGYDLVEAKSRDELPPAAPYEYFVSDGPTSDATAHVFIRTRGHLWQVARQRYFETFVRPVMEEVHFGRGWHDVEEDAAGLSWRWTQKEGELDLEPVATGRGELTLSFYLPLDAVPRPPVITLTMNGKTVDQFAGRSRTMSKRYAVVALANAPNHLILSTDEVVNPQKQGLGNDARDLGIQLRRIGWRPLPPAR